MEKKLCFRDLKDFDISPEMGFLYEQTMTLPGSYFLSDFEELAKELPKYLACGQIRACLDDFSKEYETHFRKSDDLEHQPLTVKKRVKQIYDFWGHAYVWGSPGEKPKDKIPKGLSLAWYKASDILGRRQVLSYDPYALSNWWRIDPSQPVELGNIALIQNFLGGYDEEGFILPHVEIEYRAAPAIAATFQCQQAMIQNDLLRVENTLLEIAAANKKMYVSLLKLRDLCDPYIYYNRVRPYIHGWKNNPALPHGLILEGIRKYKGKPQKESGETGAQSSIAPSEDALLGIKHTKSKLSAHLVEMRYYMPPGHRAFIEAIEAGPNVNEFNKKHQNKNVQDAEEECKKWLFLFRDLHLKYAAVYIFQQAQKTPGNPPAIGTGGTSFMPSLKKHRDETVR